LAQTFGARAGVAVLPAEGAVEQGFERIDRERAWAGVLATRGDAVEALGVLPPDADPIAGLLRVALQRGATAVAVPDKWLDQSRWALIATPAAAEQYQAGWYLRHVPAPAFDRPGAAVAHRLAQRIVARVNNAARAATGLIAGGAIGALGSAVAGYLGYTVAAMAGLAAASALLATGSALGRLARAGSREGSRAWPPHARRALLDLSLVAIAASPSVFEGWTAAFAALVLVATIRIAREPFAPFALRWLSDRTVVFVLLTVAAVAGGFIPALALLALFGLVLHLFWPRSKQLTPV
jgi:hypothetical protein